MMVPEIMDLIDVARKEINMEYSDIKICELGNQRTKWKDCPTGKLYLTKKLGVKEHISIDVNGRDGALVMDLAFPIVEWKNYFDIVTNFGTTEHVFVSIYQAFRNIHNFTRFGGAMINVGPVAGGCPWHSPYHYKPEFFSDLAKWNGYLSILSEIRVLPPRRKQTKLDSSLACAVFIKARDSDFISEEKFRWLNGIEGLK